VVPFAKNSLPNGLQLLVDVEAFDYAVSTTGSEGLIVSILHQLDIPIMKNIGINIQPGQDGQIAITPTLISTNQGARKRFTPVRRQCYFEDEISLFHFPVEDGYRYKIKTRPHLKKVLFVRNDTIWLFFIDFLSSFFI
jgi:hypothetical protein